MDITRSVRHLAGQAVECCVQDVDGRFGRRLRFAVTQQGTSTRSFIGSLVTTAAGRGRFFCWLPRDASELAILIDDATASEGQTEPRFVIKALSMPRAVALMLRRNPETLYRISKLFFKGNKKGARVRFVRAFRRLSEPDYQTWLTAQRQAAEEIRAQPQVLSAPRVLITINDGPDDLVAATQNSLVSATASIGTENCSIVSGAGLAEFLERHGADDHLFWIRLPAGSTLEEGLLEKLDQEFREHPSIAVIYMDEDILDRGGKSNSPFLKPGWNLPLAESGWLPLDGAAIRTTVLSPDLDLSADMAEIILSIARRHGSIIRHLPVVGLHRRLPPINIRRPAVARSAASAAEAKVSIVIPTRDRADLLKACLDGVAASTAGIDLDLIVIDNESTEEATHELLALNERERGLRRIELPGRFNFSRACNLGVEAARHDLVLLLNNDTEPLSGEWLRHMINEMQSPDVGAVGALLTYPDGIVQHAGVTLSPAMVAYHTFQFYDPQDEEDRGLLSERRDVAAVTAACLLTRKSFWTRAGGMDEINLPVAFNDVDYCLRLRQLGLRILWTPHAHLLHRESVSRRRDRSSEAGDNFRRETRFMQTRWNGVLGQDPFHNPNYSLCGEEFILEAFPAGAIASAADGQLKIFAGADA